MNFVRPSSKRRHGFDMTPMIDVVFQLIIFFMYTAQFAQATRTPIDLPDQPGDEHRAHTVAEIVVDIRADGTYIAQREVIAFDALIRKVQVEIDRSSAPGDLSILIRAHRDCPMTFVNRLATRLALMGVRRVILGTAEQFGPG